MPAANISLEQMAKLDKLWTFVSSDHFNELYEEVIKQESFVSKIKDQNHPSMPNPINDLYMGQISLYSDIMNDGSRLVTLLDEVKKLIQVLDDDANPYSTISKQQIHGQIQAIKNALQWL